MDSVTSSPRDKLVLQDVAQRPAESEKAHGLQEDLRRLVPSADSTRSQQALLSACR